MNAWKYKGSSSFYPEEAGKICWGKSLSPGPMGNLSSKHTRGALGPSARGCACRDTVVRENVAHQGAPRSPSVHAERQGLTRVRATSLQGLGGPVGDLGLHPEETQSLKCTAWPGWRFRERTWQRCPLILMSRFQMRKPRTQGGPPLA